MSSVARKTVAPRRANSRKVALRAVRNGSRVCMMQVLKKELRYECLSYLPPLTDKQIGAQVDYITNNGWTPCIEFAEPENSFAKEDLACGPGYYANRYYPCGSCLSSGAPTR